MRLSEMNSEHEGATACWLLTYGSCTSAFQGIYMLMLRQI